MSEGIAFDRVKTIAQGWPRLTSKMLGKYSPCKHVFIPILDDSTVRNSKMLFIIEPHNMKVTATTFEFAKKCLNRVDRMK